MIRRLASRPELRRKIAESSPKSLLMHGYFWAAQPDFWIIMGGSLVAFIILAPYTYVFAQGWVLLTIAVQLLAVYGAFNTIRAMAKIEVETAIVGEVEVRAAYLLSQVKAHPNSRVDLKQLEQDVLPNNQSTPPLSMIRMFQQIVKEAYDRKFESSINIVQPYREEALEDIFRLQNIQKIALWLGILGTFIGLLRAIQLSDLGAVNQENIFRLISVMFENLFISFSASLAGLEVAVILGAFLLLLRKRQESYFQTMESSVVTVVSLARNSTNKDDFLVEFGQIRQSLNTLRDQLYNETKELSGGMESLGERVSTQTQQIERGMLRLSETGTEFDGFLKQASERHQQLIDDVKSVYDSISLRNLGASLQESLGKTGQILSDALTPNVNRLAGEISKFNSSLDRLSTSIDLQSKTAADQVTEMVKQVAEHNRKQAETISVLKATLHDVTAKVGAIDVNRLSHDIVNLSAKVSKLNENGSRSDGYPRRRSLRDLWSSWRLY
jgi:biopolymer transport protein ExbB/TolQ